ncbi:hypothetical protein SteCoe_37415 [Stentor coeruleus]|uniref:Uncharacterized protein n=1 Tax=Stentor coeruleus TaxID=5963 RepID=A0A1R2AN18_9CILI|nr:hypothetical protein SteCoe_37415 [Stentor coeruleus]
MEISQKKKNLSRMVKPKLFSFDCKTLPQNWGKKKIHSLSLDKNFSSVKHKMPIEDFLSFDHSQFIPKSFGLKVVSKKRYALCEIRDSVSIRESQKRTLSDKIRLITDFYTRKKSLDKAKEQKKASVNLEIDLPQQELGEVHKVYYTFRDNPNFRPNTGDRTIEKSRRVIKIQVPNSSATNSFVEDFSSTVH